MTSRGCFVLSSSRVETTRRCTSSADSPAGTGAVERLVLNRRHVARPFSSSNVRPVHSPKSNSFKLSRRPAARPCDAANGVAVSTARSSGLQYTAVIGVLASRAVRAAAWPRPVALNAIPGRRPVRRRPTASVWPWRISRATVASASELIGPSAPALHKVRPLRVKFSYARRLACACGELLGAEVPAPRDQLRIGEGINHGAGVPPAMHQAGVEEHLQVLRRGRLLHPERCSELPHGLFTARQGLDDANADRFAEGAGAAGDEADMFLGKTLHN